MAAIYPFQLCAAILRGFNAQLKKDGIIQDGAVGLHCVDDDRKQEAYQVTDKGRYIGGCSVVTGCDDEIMAISSGYVDDLTGTQLDTELVKAAIG